MERRCSDGGAEAERRRSEGGAKAQRRRSEGGAQAERRSGGGAAEAERRRSGGAAEGFEGGDLVRLKGGFRGPVLVVGPGSNFEAKPGPGLRGSQRNPPTISLAASVCSGSQRVRLKRGVGVPFGIPLQRTKQVVPAQQNDEPPEFAATCCLHHWPVVRRSCLRSQQSLRCTELSRELRADKD